MSSTEEKKIKYNEIPSKPGEAVTVNEKTTTDPSTDGRVSLKKVEGVVVAPKKKNILERLVVGIAGPNGVKGIVSNLYSEIIVPAIQQTLFDSVTRGFHQAIFGEGEGAGPIVQRGRTNYAQISQYHHTPAYSIPNPAATPNAVNQVHQKNTLEPMGIRDRSQAELALNELTVNASRYGVSSVADYLEILGQPSDFTHNGFGWTHHTLLGVRIIPRSGVYYLDLPRPVQIGNTP